MPTLQEEYDVLAGELRGLNVRLDLPEDDGISQAQPIGAEYDALAGELRGLNARLGLPENDGIPLTSSANSEYENLVQQNNALDQRLSALFPTFDEWNAEQDELDKRSNWEATKTFGSNFITGAGAMLDEGGKALDEITSGKAGWDSLGGIWEVGKRDFVRFAKTMGGAAEDWLPTTESERSREYRRAKENFDYYQTVRPLMVDAVGGDAKNLVSFGAQFVDPFMALPVAGVAAKVGAVGLKSARLGRAAAALDKVGEVVSLPSEAVAAATRKGLKGTAYVAGKAAGLVGTAGGGVAKLAGLPRELTTKLAKKVLPEAASEGAGGALFASQILGGASGMLPGAAELGIGEIAGFIANRTGKGLESVLTTLAAPGAQQRFLQRLAQTAESPRMRRLALIAHRKGLTKAGDVAFNSLVNGASIASINGALAYLSGESAEGIGQAAGAGMVMGGALPFGQPGQKAGKAQSSRDATSINYLEGKLASEQVKEFRKLTPEARLVAATAEEAGIPIPKLFFVDSKMFLDLMRQDDPNAREAQSAMYDPQDKTIYVNQDISSKSSSRAVMQMFTEELGHHFITEAIKTDPMFGHQILAEYKAKEGEKSHTFIFERDPDGNPLRTIEINEKGKKLADAYSSISDDVNVGIGNNANLLAQEIGAAQFSIMMDENPNLFPHLAQPIRHKLVNASQKILSLMGITDKFGNTLPLNIASKLKRSPAIRNLYRNYLKQREMHMAGKIDLAEKGQSIPLKRGESPEAGAERLFGATGLSLKDAKAFVINNRQIKRELTKLKNQYQDAPADGWSVVRGRLIGKELTPDMRAILTRTNPDPRGSVNIIINDVQAAIADNSEVNFLFRSGKPSKYSDNELKVRVVAPVGLEFSGMAGKGAAGLYMQGMDIAYLKNNVEVLVQEGFIKDPDKFIAEARQVAKNAVSDPEGRINPEGKFENELITVALGNKASADFIKNPKLARLLEEGRLQHSFRQYHIGSLAGIALTGRPGIGFDWYNVKRNYSPHGRNFMPRRKPNQPDDTIPLPFDELPGDKPGEGFGRMINVDRTKAEMAEAKKLGEAQSGFSSSGTVRAKNADGRDKLFMPAAYHGTPHTFKAEEGAPLGRFRSAQIGTGEGRQAFGHGLYFTSRAMLGEHYRQNLTKDRFGGSLYKVELAPKENEYLLWDTPLSDQPKGVQEKLLKLGHEMHEVGAFTQGKAIPYRDGFDFHMNGGQLYSGKKWKDGTFRFKGLSSLLGGKPEASAALKAVGIPGIKYLDGQSRGNHRAIREGKATFNYVLFDEANVAITDKLFMPAESKGQRKKILLRTKQEMSDAVDSLAAERGISRNDALNELLNSALLDPKMSVGKRSEGDITLALTPEEIALLEKTEIGPEESADYKAAIAKRRAISEREIGVKNRLYMPADRALGLPDNIRDEVLPGIKQDKFSRGQLEAALLKSAGSKAYAEEIGLMDWLKDRKSVTKAEVDQFVRENAPRLEEKKISGKEADVSLREQDRTRIESGDEVIQIDAEGDYFTITVDEDAGNVHVQGDGGKFLELDAPINRQTEQDGWRAIENHYREKQGPPTKFSEYQEPGGTNYREVLIKLPEKSANNPEMQALRQEAQSILEKRQAFEAEGRIGESNALSNKHNSINRRIQYLQSQDNFRDPHFNEDNVLLHLRLNDRIDANGKKVLFIEELQSDWHQKGRKEGYDVPLSPKEEKALKDRLKEIQKERELTWKTPNRLRELEAEQTAINEKLLVPGIPDAPFKKNWPALGLKRAIREALENGYDRIAWLDGEGQAARYDLSQHVDSIVYVKNKNGTYDVEVIVDRSVEVGKDNQSPRQLEELVGKEVAQKITEGEGSKPDDYNKRQSYRGRLGGWKELSGLDLKVGGEGMKAFYDRELVSIANKISKKIGGGKVRRERVTGTGNDRPRTPQIGVLVTKQFGSHVLDLPKNPQAVENLRLYMPAQKAPSDSGVPTILKDAKGRGALAQPRAIESGFGTENIDAPRFVDKVLGDLKVDVQRTNFEKPEVNLADHYGKNALITMTDRTPTDHVIYGINDVQFKTPLRLEGGRDYMFDSAHSPGAAWANEQGAMTAMLNRRGKLGGEDMLVIPMEMAPTSVDFPTMAPALHIRYAQVAMKSKDKRYVNSLVKKGGKGFLTKSQDQVKVPKFDIDMENVEAFLSKLSGPQRKTINNVFDMVNRPSSAQKGKGVRQIDGALSNFEMRAAISDPAMFNQKSLMQTTNVGLMTGGQAPSMHSTYNAAMKGKGLGVLKVPEGFQPKAQDFLPDLFKKSNKDYVHPNDAYTTRMGVRTTKIDDALLKRLGL